MIGICSAYKNDQKNDSDWKCLIRLYSFWYLCGMQYTKTELVYWLVNGFFVIPPLCPIPEATRNDYFWLVYVIYTTKRYKYSNLFYLLCLVRKIPQIWGCMQRGMVVAWNTSTINVYTDDKNHGVKYLVLKYNIIFPINWWCILEWNGLSLPSPCLLWDCSLVNILDGGLCSVQQPWGSRWHLK